jgi:hypothetical protein
MTHYMKGMDKQVVNTRTRKGRHHRPLHRHPGPPRSRQPHAGRAGRPHIAVPDSPRSRLPLRGRSGRRLRVNATGTDIWPDHEVTERHPDGGLTVRYLAGPKRHLLIHFFSNAELGVLFGSGFEPVVPLRPQHTWRAAPEPGRWTQWEAIWRRIGGDSSVRDGLDAL